VSVTFPDGVAFGHWPTLGGLDLMNPSERRLCDAREMDGLIAAMGRRLAEASRPGLPLYLVGVRTRGVPLADRLAGELRPLRDAPVDVGAVDITLYRDDLGQAERWPVL